MKEIFLSITFRLACETKMVPYIVSCDWLDQKMKENDMSNIVVVDVSWASARDCREEYDRCHISGAVYLNTICGENTDVYPRAIPSEEKFEQLARVAGINVDSHVIVYSSSDRCGYFISGRGWWSFKYFGHKNVSILDGGLQKWQELGYPTTHQDVQIKRGNFKAKNTGILFTSYNDVCNNLATQTFQVCDNRPFAAFSGQESPGHIPGAKNLTMAKLVSTDTGLLRPVEEIKQIFQDSGVDLEKPIATHCNSGMSSCTVAMAALMCGAQEVTVYMGGFTEWKKRNPENIEKS